ncbi:MAG: nucleotidyltransferase domain-containing protein [Nitrospirae bacterium]|nr:nucleotidyltransferase domain-containing protein [Nitrospirota bacterium]
MTKQSIENISTLSANERNAISEFVKSIREKLGSVVMEIILFGSKVRGDSGKESDIDILLVLTSLSWGIKKTISELAAEENIKYNVLTSTIRYDADTWEKPVIKASPFGTAVREEGIWL